MIACWRSLDSAPSEGTLVDLWHEDRRIPDCWQDALGRWLHREDGPPQFFRVIPNPSFWHARPADPIIPKGE